MSEMLTPSGERRPHFRRTANELYVNIGLLVTDVYFEHTNGKTFSGWEVNGASLSLDAVDLLRERDSGVEVLLYRRRETSCPELVKYVYIDRRNVETSVGPKIVASGFTLFRSGAIEEGVLVADGGGARWDDALWQASCLPIENNNGLHTVKQMLQVITNPPQTPDMLH